MLLCDDLDEVDIPEDDVDIPEAEVDIPEDDIDCMDVDHLEASSQTSQAGQKPQRSQQDSEQWIRQKVEIERIGAWAWQQGQGRLEEELRVRVYGLYHEVQKLQNDRSQMEGDWQRQCQPQQRSPERVHEPQHPHSLPVRPALDTQSAFVEHQQQLPSPPPEPTAGSREASWCM
jgi:hypothetical protein